MKGRKARAETKVKKTVRPIVAHRDGFCRLAHAGFGRCIGHSEWAHLEEKKRARTRGMAPEVRHTTAESAMLCTRHHHLYDAGEIRAAFTTEKKADGPMEWASKLNEIVYREGEAA